ncbi:MAG: 16S rRNA (guanine(527)-N(7))-methyltransferase RsmG [Flavobacteriaceae bacterium]
MEPLFSQFDFLSPRQKEQFMALKPLYTSWNAKINVVSRKDIDHFDTRHLLHSLALAKVQPFMSGASIIDVGTGGGFPGIPLAILFPQTQFVLVDSIGKKIKVVNEVKNALGLTNVKTYHSRIEQVDEKADFIISRAVTAMDQFVPWVKDKIKKKNQHTLANGLLYLKGGDLSEELKNFPQAQLFPITDYFQDPFFATKKVVYLPL